jgi:hypothetical protein
LHREATTWTHNEWVQFIGFAINISSLGSGGDSSILKVLFSGADGKCQLDEAQAVEAARRLMALAAIRRHGLLRSLALYSRMGVVEEQGLFVEEEDAELDDTERTKMTANPMLTDDTD